MISLRNRAVAGAIIWSSAVVLGGSFLIGKSVNNVTLARFDELLTARHTQVVLGLINSNGVTTEMPTHISDPVFQRPFSGNYWQVESDNGDVAVSRSMADTLFEIPDDAKTGFHLRTIAGPADQTLRIASQWLSLDNGSEWLVTAASSTQPLEMDREALQAQLNYAFSLIGVFAMIGSLFIVLFTLRPLTKLRKDVADRWDHEGDLPEDNYPEEVLPLVLDINELLARNRDIVSRSRKQTADLAHALKTPSAIMRNELLALNMDGKDVQASMDALDRLDAQLNRSFARMKANQENASEQASTDIDTALGRMGRAFTALARNKDRDMQTDITPSLTAKINQNDLEEILGNLLDNALKWSNSAIKLGAFLEDKFVVITVEDDGPGIPAEDRKRALLSGQRLDESKPGTGLGLAIAADLASAYQGSLKIETSELLGGARAEVRLLQSSPITTA